MCLVRGVRRIVKMADAYMPCEVAALQCEPGVENVRKAIKEYFWWRHDAVLSSVPLSPEDEYDPEFAARYLFIVFHNVPGEDGPWYAHLGLKEGEEKKLFVYRLPRGYLPHWKAKVTEAWQKRAPE